MNKLNAWINTNIDNLSQLYLCILACKREIFAVCAMHSGLVATGTYTI